MSEIHNAKITGTMLGFEDHGIMTCFVYLEWDGGGVGFGGYALDEWQGERGANGKRVGVAYSLDFLKEIMEVVGVEKWEALEGKYIRVDSEGWGGKALGIGNLLKDKWFYPKEFFKEHGVV
jgi:hypothetical protein